jgi:hypothetical protein
VLAVAAARKTSISSTFALSVAPVLNSKAGVAVVTPVVLFANE